jgi:hypothetical protein
MTVLKKMKYSYFFFNSKITTIIRFKSSHNVILGLKIVIITFFKPKITKIEQNTSL